MNEICLSCRKHTKCGRAKHETIGCGYYVPMSNEEWIKSMTTEELAEFIRKQRDDWSDGWYSDWHPFSEIVEWLKQPHLTSK